MGISSLVEGCPLFYDFYDQEIEKILSGCCVLKFKEGEYILKQGEEGTEIFIILLGKVEIIKETKAGPLLIGNLLKGDLFGELVLINKNKRTASVKALTDCEILVIEYKSIFNLYKKDAKIFALLLLNLARLLTNRLESTGNLIESIQNKSTAKRKLARAA